MFQKVPTRQKLNVSSEILYFILKYYLNSIMYLIRSGEEDDEFKTGFAAELAAFEDENDDVLQQDQLEIGNLFHF